MQHEEIWIALAEALGPRSHALKPLLAAFETPEEIFAADAQQLLDAVPWLGKGVVASLTRKDTLDAAKRIALWCHRNGVRILTMDAPEYPACLREIAEPPAVLYCRGTLQELDRSLTLGIVGPREPDAYGENEAYKISFALAAAGFTVISGMAKGIDGIAAAAAIGAGGKTVAVLGTGIDITYPRHHTRLATEILENGAIITEFAPGTKPLGRNFPIRNRLISALSRGVFLPEAEESSGALITARYALLQGKMLFALPGDINNPRSAGTNRLLANGAAMVLSAEDILEQYRFLYHDLIDEKAFRESAQHAELSHDVVRRFGLHLSKEKDVKPEKKSPRRRAALEPAPQASAPAPDLSVLNDRQHEIFSLLPETPFTPDVLTAAAIPVAEAVATLTVLEIYGLITSRPGGMYQKK